MDTLTNIGQGFIDFYNSGFFAFIKFLLGIYAAVLLADIILLLFQRGLLGDIKETLTGMNVPREITTKKGKLAKKWGAIRNKLESPNESSWKVAIIEADDVISDLIKRMGYLGENTGERLAAINPGQIENIEELKEAHEMRNKIVHDESFELSRDEAERIFRNFENFLRYYEVLG